ncbi:porin family protein [uncultured Legionella sp.]|uniref:outer membrane protein n=1 Tax=uncultured Legionella sp. TaxID=210934 RepID=UPI00260344D0|nr:porin family protein [uncultured Legionella sp.]
MIKKRPIIGFLSMTLASITQAGTMGPTTTMKTWSNVLTLSAGPIWATGGALQSLYFSDELSRTYTANKKTHALTEGELFIGRQRLLNPRVEGQLGVEVAVASKLKLSGDIWEFEDPRFYDYTHSYTLQHHRIALKGKLLVNASNLLKPWISASIGIGRNKAASYKETPLICETEPLPTVLFPTHSTTALTYTLGAGVQRIVSEHWQIGLGYEFADWGKSRLAGAPAQPSGSNGLALNHLHTNGLLFNITWLA